MSDKILIANVAALKIKYGAEGFRGLLKAIGILIAADHSRGLKTQLVDISDSRQMKKYKGVAVSKPLNERQNKEAVDAIYTATNPQYLVLLDGPDVIPHITLKNPTPADGDLNVPSDLPYASDRRLSGRDPALYAAVTRVVARMPGVRGASDPTPIVTQLKCAAAFRSRPLSDYLGHFAISAQVWRKSTELSADNIFGSKKIMTCPPTDSPQTQKMLAPLSHFINCHGGTIDPQFYGQRGNKYPVSMTSTDVAKGTKRNTIVAAECCFGAQLFDPNEASGAWPISNTYLNAGAIAFFGSTTIAYGPAEGNGSADLLAQYFLINALNGASTGRACLQARQKFVHTQKMEDPVNLKTVAQFVLLGDPSLQPVRDDLTHIKAASKFIDYREARRTRRLALVALGEAAADCSGFPGAKVRRGGTKLHKLVHKIARQRGFRSGAKTIEAYHVVGGEGYGSAMKSLGAEQKVFVATHQERTAATKARGVPLTRILVAHAQNDRLVDVFEYIRR